MTAHIMSSGKKRSLDNPYCAPQTFVYGLLRDYAQALHRLESMLSNILQPSSRSSFRRLTPAPRGNEVDIERRQADDLDAGRVVYTAVGLICLLLAGVLFGIRIRNLQVKNIRQLNLTRILVFGVYFDCIIFLFTTNLLYNGFDLTSSKICHGSILLCLGCYFVAKVCINLFLIERAHVARTSVIPRWRDWIWIIGVCIVTSGLVAMLVSTLMFPRSSASDGTCWIGIENKATLVVLAIDIFINIGLTGFFISLLLPIIRFSRIASAIPVTQLSSTESLSDSFGGGKQPTVTVSTCAVMKSQPIRRKSTSTARLETLFKKSIAGAFLMLLPTVANAIVLTTFHGKEKAWICLTSCALDVTWQACVIFWLTVDPVEMENSTGSNRTSVASVV